MELGNKLFFWCGELIFARKRDLFLLLFYFYARKRHFVFVFLFVFCVFFAIGFLVFLCFLGGVFVLFFTFCFRAQRDFFLS